MGRNALSANKPESQKRKSGIATIKVVEDNCKVTFQDDSVEFDTGKNSKKFPLEDMPKFPKLSEGEKDYFVVLNGDADSVDSIGPVEGVFPAKFVGFNLGRADEDKDPAPFEKDSKNEKWPSYLAMLAFFEIQSGPFKRVRIPYFLHYKFEESSSDAGMAAWKGDPENRKATRLHQLIEFCEKLGLTDEPIEWPDDGNILPELQERGLDDPKTVRIVVKNGYMDSILSSDGDEEEEEEEKPKAKAPAKKKLHHDEDEEDF